MLVAVRASVCLRKSGSVLVSALPSVCLNKSVRAPVGDLARVCWRKSGSMLVAVRPRVCFSRSGPMPVVVLPRVLPREAESAAWGRPLARGGWSAGSCLEPLLACGGRPSSGAPSDSIAAAAAADAFFAPPFVLGCLHVSSIHARHEKAGKHGYGSVHIMLLTSSCIVNCSEDLHSGYATLRQQKCLP